MPKPITISTATVGLGIRIRIFQQKDYEALRKLFQSNTSSAPGSPLQVAFEKHRHSASAYLSYAIFGSGVLILGISPMMAVEIPFPPSFSLSLFSHLPLVSIGKTGILRALGVSLILSSSFLFFYPRILLRWAYEGYARDALEKDLKDIAGHYQLRATTNPDDGTGSTRDSENRLEPTGIKSVWVAEAIESGEIVGCIALDTPSEPNYTQTLPTSLPSLPHSFLSSLHPSQFAELRRMSVSGTHRKRGIGQSLLRTLLAHARVHGVRVVILETTGYQESALRLYKRAGWEEAVERMFMWRVGTVAPWGTGLTVKILQLWLDVENGWRKVNAE